MLEVFEHPELLKNIDTEQFVAKLREKHDSASADVDYTTLLT